MTRSELQAIIAAIIYASDPDTRRPDPEGRRATAARDIPNPYNAVVVADGILQDIQNHYRNA